ncbi:histidine kinase N-terminal 7TM domain-containing protein [Clostridium sp. BL-8]|uniref:histidine kinase N-terminal 7TM domain-containing diguanylate cyclase n=1 Tax=Clostridium sp. BL-8 TaxID=349938 RepID=UPI00098CB612|nr:histidine kinase N-terminal 7TM domain-containing protein [Clostridium sp. BL-8]OOM80051.1 putative diguanylate cyclase YcdT [Clostridium sp. BL-8]
MRCDVLNVNYYFSLILFVSAVVLVFIGYFSWKRNKVYMSMCLLPVSIYEFGYAFEILSTSLEKVKFWIKVEYLGIAFLPVVWLMLALNFNGYEERLKKSTLKLFYIVPVITLIMNYTNDFHHLFYESLYMNNDGIFPIVEIVKGPFYWLNIVYTYSSMLAGLIIFIFAYSKAVSIVRKQILLLIMAWIIPWISDIVYTLRLMPFNLDLCPLAFSFSGIISSYAILNFKLLKLAPIALEKVFSNMLDGVIILDSENNIVNFNDSSQNIISELKNIKAGDKKIDEVLKEYKEVLKALNSDSYNESLITIKNYDKLRYFKININNIYRKNDEIIGKILIFNDVTEIKLHAKKLADNFKFLETLMNAIPHPIYSKDEQGGYNHFNTAFIEFLGITKEELIGNTAYDVFGKGLAERYYESDRNLIEKNGTQVYESKLKHNDNTYHDVIFSKSVVKDEHDKNKGLVGVIMDITEEKKNRERIDKLLKLKEVMVKIGYSINEITNINDLLQLILDEVINCIDEQNSGSILLLDEDKNLKIAVAKGYDSEEIKTFSIKLDEHRLRFNNGEKINETVIFNDIYKSQNINMLDTMEGVKIRSSISSPIIIEGKLYGFLNIDSIYNNAFNEGDIELMEYMRNQASIAIAKHKLYEETLYLSRYDKLTNVYNRSYFEQLVNTNIYSESADKKEFCAAVFDLNSLKFVNDNYGHLCGDELIKTFAKGLSTLRGTSDIIGRFGGDEFIGIFFDIDQGDLVNRFEELAKSFKSNPISFGERTIVCSYSYGIVNGQRDGMKFNELLKIADARMYEYKRLVKSKKI